MGKLIIYPYIDIGLFYMWLNYHDTLQGRYLLIIMLIIINITLQWKISLNNNVNYN